jgi:uncharacterized protein YkwD
MPKKSHLFLIAVFCLQLVAAANLPQTFQPDLSGANLAQLIPPVTTDGEIDQFAEPESSGCAPVIIPVQNEAYEQELVELVNAERTEAGLPPLKSNPALSNASRYHANDMMADVYFNHDTYDRVSDTLSYVCGVWQRISQFYSYDLAAGENIAAGQATPEDAMSAWMASDGHRANILGANFREIGVGYYSGGNWFKHFWVQDFGTRANVYPIVINLESASTDNRDLSVYLYGKGVFSEYRIKDDSSSWSAWQPFQERVNWTLSGPGDLTRTVTVEMRKSSGEISTSSDSIFLNGQASLGNLPQNVEFLYIKETGVLYTYNNILQPLNVGTTDVLNWSLSFSEAWIAVSDTCGTTPDTEVVVTPQDFTNLQSGSYSSSLTFIVTSPMDVYGSPTAIPVSLIIVDQLDNSVFLPLVLR